MAPKPLTKKMIRVYKPCGVNNKTIKQITATVAKFAKDNGVSPDEVKFTSNRWSGTEISIIRLETDAELAEREKERARMLEQTRKNRERAKKLRDEEKAHYAAQAVNAHVSQRQDLAKQIELLLTSDPALAKKVQRALKSSS